MGSHSPQYDDYQRAKELIAEGERTAAKIRTLDDARKGYAEGDDEWLSLTRQMDEYGKKAMGVWAQAQVHATLAQTPNHILSSGWQPAPRPFGTEYLTAGHDLSEGGTR